MLKINIRHSLLSTCFLEIRFAPECTITEVKERIYRMTGTPPEFQELTLVKSNGAAVSLGPDKATLQDFHIQSGHQISVVDKNPYAIFGGAFKKAAAEYKQKEVDEEKYKATPGTVYDQIQIKLKTDPAFREKYEESFRKRRERAALEMTKASNIKIGDRCEISGRRRGVVRFIGEKFEKCAGIVLGIELDEPLGDCDGDGEFQCQKSHGIFLNVMDVEVGDFPVLGFSDIEDSDEL